jgi:hypothetical protein
MVKLGVTSYPVHGAFIHKKETNKLDVCVYTVYYYIYIYLFVGSHPYTVLEVFTKEISGRY